MVKTFINNDFGYEVEIGKVARQADGAVWFKQGGTVILATAVTAASDEFPGFFPLTIDYRENFSAAGKIPGGYFKREGKPSDREVLTGRLIDRAIRPLFPENYFNQVQIIVTVYSVDKEHTPNTVALSVASLALALSQAPFMGPVGVIEVARVDGQWIYNPKYSQMKQSDARVVVAGTQEGICMVEGSLEEVSETDLVDVLFHAHELIKKDVAWQKEIVAQAGKEKELINDKYSWDAWTTLIDQYLTADRVAASYIADKAARNEYLTALKDEFKATHKEQLEEGKVPSKVLTFIFDALLQEKITEHIFIAGKRVDSRGFEDVRDISIEVGILPFVHGSSLFTRGETQALVSVTLGGGQDAKKMESLMEVQQDDDTFMLHYNFPPFSVGEVRSMRGTSRREVGHGHLASSAFTYMLPKNEDFPYTIRIVSDILESNGSSSMATVCGSTMALMEGGVPLRKMVGGIAMGLLMNKAGQFQVLSDISGFEDAFGLMDFKVAGTRDGITAIQMDIKYKGGLKKEVFVSALAQARVGRMHILGEMEKVMTAPAGTLSPLVPKVMKVKINPEKIGAIIGSGGKTIREIIAQTGTTIDVEEDGTVKIFGKVGAGLEKAVAWVKTLAGQIEPGEVFNGKVRRIADFGLFVELVPGFDGLLHVSNIPKDKQRTFGRSFKLNDPITVKVLDYDDATGRVSLKMLDE
jgi:polyribonucleotide nucleotidyltransferase